MQLRSGGRKGTSDVEWHPDIVFIFALYLLVSLANIVTRATTLVTSEDDSSPVVIMMLWDLRNVRAPEKVSNVLVRFCDLLDI